MGNQGVSGSSNARARFSDYYVSGERIGSGTFAIVKKCHRKNAPHQQFAVKIVDKRRLTTRELVGLKYEIKILRTMDHPSVLKAIDVFENKRKVKIILELCEGGNLFDQILKLKGKRMDEQRIAWIICKIARALKYLHEHHVCHRDLKPENILFTKDDNIKITDLGLAHYLKLPPNLHTMHTCCGTPHYVAPEVLACTEYGVEVDFWSLGVILYVLLSGHQPFNSKSIRTMYGMITRGQYRFVKSQWSHVSPEAIACVKALMNVDPNQRLNCDTLCQHPFIVNNVDLREIEMEEEMMLQKQQVLLQDSCSSINLKDLKISKDIKAGYSMNKRKRFQEKFKSDAYEAINNGKEQPGIKKKQKRAKLKPNGLISRSNTAPLLGQNVKQDAAEIYDNDGLWL